MGNNKDIIILGIESSCDDTSAAIVKNEAVLSNVTANQDIHTEWGGVVPELASRAHQQNIVPVINSALKKAHMEIADLNAIAFTRGPGLMGSLIVGTSFAKSMALALDLPLVAVNHMQAHILAHFIDDAGEKKPSFPFLCLTISGGHTQLVIVRDHLSMEIVGSTKDDAAGEAFDKTAKLLGLPYPGGPLVDKYAKLGDPERFSFTKPSVPDLDFSFSGLKTNVLQFLQKAVKKDNHFIESNLYDICAGVQHTIIEILFDKLINAAEKYDIKEIAIAGGVSANSGIRKRLKDEAVKRNWEVYIPKFEYCTDNAAMIAIAGKYNYEQGIFTDQTVAPEARLKF